MSLGMTSPGPLIITIDGPAGVGKSTAARQLAARLRLAYVDTGATYRTLAYAALRAGGLPLVDARRLTRLARRLPLAMRQGRFGAVRVLLDGADVTRAIRTEAVTEAAAQIAQYPAVRAALVKRQRELALRPWSAPAAGGSWRGVVLEGRDTGSVVFPQATLKFFLNAAPAVRARRRQQEVARLSGRRPPLAQIQEQLRFRDGLDRSRRVGRLIRPPGALMLDTSRLTQRQVVAILLERIRQAGVAQDAGTHSNSARHVC
jgi:cytidylate kinase